jgi:hypothetical protein
MPQCTIELFLEIISRNDVVFLFFEEKNRIALRLKPRFLEIEKRKEVQMQNSIDE